MSEPFVGEIKLFAGNFAPARWALCQGQLLSISSNTALFSLLGTTYGGDGRTTFALPNLQGQVVVQQGQGPGLSAYYPGESVGTANVTLLQSEMPMHNHNLVASTASGTQTASSGQMLSSATIGGRPPTSSNFYSGGTPLQTMVLNEIAPAGNSQPHNNMMPYLALNYIIALVGVFPPRS